MEQKSLQKQVESFLNSLTHISCSDLGNQQHQKASDNASEMIRWICLDKSCPNAYQACCQQCVEKIHTHTKDIMKVDLFLSQLMFQAGQKYMEYNQFIEQFLSGQEILAQLRLKLQSAADKIKTTLTYLDQIDKCLQDDMFISCKYNKFIKNLEKLASVQPSGGLSFKTLIPFITWKDCDIQIRANSRDLINYGIADKYYEFSQELHKQFASVDASLQGSFNTAATFVKQLQDEIKKLILGDQVLKNPDEMRKQHDSQSATPHQACDKQEQYQFLPGQFYQNISLSQDKLMATQTVNQGEQMIIYANQKISKKSCSCIKFRVSKLVAFVGFGIGMKKFLNNLSDLWKYSDLKHGTYIFGQHQHTSQYFQFVHEVHNNLHKGFFITDKGDFDQLKQNQSIQFFRQNEQVLIRNGYLWSKMLCNYHLIPLLEYQSSIIWRRTNRKCQKKSQSPRKSSSQRICTSFAYQARRVMRLKSFLSDFDSAYQAQLLHSRDTSA